MTFGFSTFGLEHSDTETISSDPFSIPLIPVFVDVRLSLSKKRVVPYLSAQIGFSFPLVQTINGTWYKQYNNSYPYPWPFHVSSIKPGLYVGLNPGLKCFLYSKYYLDILFGWDISANKFYGDLPDEKSSWFKGTTGFHLNIGFGF